MRPREVVREIIDALNRGEVGEVLARIDAEFEWKALDDSFVAGTYVGHGQVRAYIEDWLTAFDDLRIDVDDMIEQADQVLVVVHGRARGAASGIAVENRYCQVWTVRGNTALRMHEFATRDQALAKLGAR